MSGTGQTRSYFTGQLLVAMPNMPDPRFAKTVIYMCAHSEEGAMGLVVNRLAEELSFPDLLCQVGLEGVEVRRSIEVHFGGPVESGRGFVLHSTDFEQDGTMMVDDGVALTASVDMLKEIAEGGGPGNCLLALGYSGWGPGQLDQEIQGNGWLNVAADADLVFGRDLESKWEKAIAKIGVDPSMLSSTAGRA
ncbi:MAG: YqgE/AlgH family protein [Pseudomonadota bacterium]